MQISRLIGIAVLSTLANIAFGKSVPFPDFASPDFWDNYNVSAARIVQADSRQMTILCDRIKTISGSPLGTKSITIAFSNAIFLDLDEVHSFSTEIKAGTNVLVCEPRQPYLINQGNRVLQFAYVKTMGDPGADPFARAAQKIGQIHSDHSASVLLTNAVAKEDLLAEYCLRRLLMDSAAKATPPELERLRAVQDDESRQPKVRLLACQTVLKLSGQPDRSDAEYKWLQAAIRKSSRDWTYNLFFTRQLPEFPNHRKDTITFLLDLAKNPKLTPALRGPAIDPLESRLLFNYRSPDEESEKIFAAGLGLLKDDEPSVVMNAAALLNRICETIDQSKRRAYMDRAIPAVKAAAERETNSPVYQMIEVWLNNLQGLPG